MWWLSLDGKLNLPFNEPDAVLLGIHLPTGERDAERGQSDKRGERADSSWESAHSSSRAGLLALEPRMLLLAAAGYYEATGRTARDLECLAGWLSRALELQQARFVPILQRRRSLLRIVQRRRESYLRHLRRHSDGVELKRQLRRLLRDSAHYPGRWRAGRLLKRWCSADLLEQLAQLQPSEILQSVFWPAPRLASGCAGRAGQAAPVEAESAGDPAAVPGTSAPVTSTLGNSPQSEPARGDTALGETVPDAPVTSTGEKRGELVSHQPALVEEQGQLPSASFRVDQAALQRWLQAEKLAALRQLAYGASHEINNPLANIAMRAEMLLRSEGEEDRQRKLQVIRQQALRAHEMISDLMLFANPPRPCLEEIELEGYLQRLMVELQPDVALARGELRLEVSHPGLVVADSGQLAEIVRALVRNALEAQPAGAQVTIRAAVTPEGGAFVEVLDNGPGITTEVARHMFDPFFSSREAGRGLGFGLTKAWRIAESHGGRLECLERTAGATRFRFQWPRLACPAKAA